MLKKTYTILAVALTATACGGATEPSDPGSSEGQLSGGQCDTKAVNAELERTSLDDAVANRAHFRCLCDDEGYPLVGNLNSKATITTASEFCEELRGDGLL